MCKKGKWNLKSHDNFEIYRILIQLIPWGFSIFDKQKKRKCVLSKSLLVLLWLIYIYVLLIVMLALFKRVGRWMKCIGRFVLITVNNIYGIPGYLGWSVLLLPLLLIRPWMYWALEGELFHSLLSMVALWSHSAHYHILETGDGIDPLVDEETLLIVNHQSTSDVPLLMAALASRRNLLQRLSWIMDAVFKYTNFGCVSILHGDFFINAGRDKREKCLLDLVLYLKNSWMRRGRKWIVLFPEGGFLRKRRHTSNKYARKLGHPQLNWVTLPRMGAIQAILDTVGMLPDGQEGGERSRKGRLKWLVDLTIAYSKGKPLGLLDIITAWAPPSNVIFHYRVFPIQQIPHEKTELQFWLFARYLEKEKMLEKYYESGDWDEGVTSLGSRDTQHQVTKGGEARGPALSARRVEQNLRRIFLIHIFFIVSTLFHIFIFTNIYVKALSIINNFSNYYS